MPILEVIFWISLLLLFYTYIGYGLILFSFVLFKRMFKKSSFVPISLPVVTLIIPAYNEITCIAEKVANCFHLDYPADRLKLLFVSEGSTDGTLEFLAAVPGIVLIKGSQRRGKIDAMNQAMQQVDTPLVIFSDANTLLNRGAIKNLVRHYANPKVGAVAGEKRIMAGGSLDAVVAGEGIYWKYESLLKKWDSELNTVVGAAGELFSMRTDLYKEVEKDTLLDDFMISMRLAGQGYKVAYEPQAYASEAPSFSVAEEMKRKVRIGAGAFQSMARLAYLLNPVRYGLLSFQYISHRVMRWTVAPLCLLLLLISNALLYQRMDLYVIFLFGQGVFYLAALLGYFLERKKVRLRTFFIPFYFCFMNYSICLGLVRFVRNSQSELWEKSRRAV